MLKIGNVALSNPVVAAPLAGVSDRAGREIARRFGCGLVYTEMISDMGLVYGQQKTRELADCSQEPGPIAAQIFGSEPAAMAKGAGILEKLGPAIIDINMGCPAPKIVRNGEGAALMREPELCRSIIRAVRDAVSIPVTIKIRKGWDDNSVNCLEIAALAEEEGVSAVALHPRTRMQYFAGHADWEMIAALKKVVRIPVIGNGDIWHAEDASRMMAETGCDAVMIGRAAMGYPFIFREVAALLECGQRVPEPEISERIETAVQHLDLTCRYKGEYLGVREMRKQFAWYIKGCRGASRIRELINLAETRDALIAAIRLIEREPQK